MFSTLRYHDLRGLMRNLSEERSDSVSQVHFTSRAVNGLPSCHLTPWRKGNVSCVPSSLHDQPVARSGTTEPMLFCATCWSKMTRLLNTPIIGMPTAIVDSSWIDIDAGLVKLGICRMPPGFWANAGRAPTMQASNQTAATHRHSLRVTAASPPPSLRYVLSRPN